MAKTAQIALSLILCVLALPCVEPAHARAPVSRAASNAHKQASPATATPKPAPASAAPTPAELARKYSPINYCHGSSYPAVSWMQVRDFLDRHSAGAPVGDSRTRIAATDSALRAIPALQYPDSKRASALDGAVAVMVAVNTDGVVSDALVVCSSDPAFSEAALTAVKAATFTAATRDGKPIESVATLPIDFHP